MIYRKAKISDVEEIHQLVSYYAAKNLMLARSRSSLYEGIREFTVAEYNGRVIGAGSLHIIWSDLAEIRALAVRPAHIQKGIGRNLVNLFLKEARQLEIKRVFALTYQQEFFIRCGFKAIAKEELPHKVWKECVNCPLFPNCEENAVIINI
uniref:N-acetyltransferase n=1 Tax=Desulforadius tongensis TaxID=1216062 RepID=UPI00195DCA16